MIGGGGFDACRQPELQFYDGVTILSSPIVPFLPSFRRRPVSGAARPA